MTLALEGFRLIHGVSYSSVLQDYVVEEDSMRLYRKGNRWLRILLFICLLSFLFTALVGFQDFNVQDLKSKGVACTLQARIVNIPKLPSGKQVLVVKKLPTAAAETIYVVVTSETISTSGDRILTFKEFRVGMLIEIQGLKVIEREDDQDN